MTGEVSRLVDRLFVGSITITGTTRSGKPGTMTIDSGGAFAFQGDPDDLTAATLEAAGRDANA